MCVYYVMKLPLSLAKPAQNHYGHAREDGKYGFIQHWSFFCYVRIVPTPILPQSDCS